MNQRKTNGRAIGIGIEKRNGNENEKRRRVKGKKGGEGGQTCNEKESEWGL